MCLLHLISSLAVTCVQHFSSLKRHGSEAREVYGNEAREVHGKRTGKYMGMRPGKYMGMRPGSIWE